MIGKKLGSFKKLAKMVKVNRTPDREPSDHHDHLLLTTNDEEAAGCTKVVKTTTPRGFFAIYVGEEPRRFVVPTAHLTHPLFKLLLEKAYDDEDRLMVPCSVAAFEKVVNTVECGCNGMFDIEHLVQEFI
ncbi:hypothetical protein SSX86_002823 [Deinandra increscens subsp. villosa]|uniref:Small auxin up regulated protein n=1 Tax=Deinandra increscens subsp. villosa TaxID=3103831 RepID=A0AAP0HDK8_9ASTR